MDSLIFENTIDSVTKHDHLIPLDKKGSKLERSRASPERSMPKPRLHRLDAISSVYSNHICHTNEQPTTLHDNIIDPSSLAIDGDAISITDSQTEHSSTNGGEIGIDDQLPIPSPLFQSTPANLTSIPLQPINIADSSLPKKMTWNWDVAQKCLGFMNMKKN